MAGVVSVMKMARYGVWVVKGMFIVMSVGGKDMVLDPGRRGDIGLLSLGRTRALLFRCLVGSE